MAPRHVCGDQQEPVVTSWGRGFELHWNYNGGLVRKFNPPTCCPTRHLPVFVLCCAPQAEIPCHEMGVEEMAVQAISHLVLQHSIDDFIIDLFPVSEAHVVSLSNSAEAKLTVDSSGWGVRPLVVNNYWLLTLFPTTRCTTISTWSVKVTGRYNVASDVL